MLLGGGLNTKSFIHFTQDANVKDIIERVKYLDEDKEAYLKMLSESSFLDVNHESLFDDKLESFLLNIFEQPLENAYRRGFGQWRCNIETRYKKFQKTRLAISTITRFIQAPSRWLKAIVKAIKRRF